MYREDREYPEAAEFAQDGGNFEVLPQSYLPEAVSLRHRDTKGGWHVPSGYDASKIDPKDILPDYEEPEFGWGEASDADGFD